MVESAVDCEFIAIILYRFVSLHTAEMPRTVSDAPRMARLLTAPAFHPLPACVLSICPFPFDLVPFKSTHSMNSSTSAAPGGGGDGGGGGQCWE